MELSKELINQFVKTTNDNKKTVSEASLFGSIVIKDNSAYVRIDGSELLTPINTTTHVNDGDRVIVRLKNHMATVTGNITSPSTNQGDLDDVVDQITEFEIVIANRVEANEIKVGTIVAENVEIKKLLSATNAEIENLKAENVEITGSLSANKAEIEDLKTKKLDAEAADIKFATIENLKVTNQEVNSIKGNFADFSVTTTEQLNAIDANIKNLDVEKLDAKDAEIKYANIDFANINMAAVEKLFAESGIIKDLVVGDTSITGELVGVTIKGDLIEANTLVADKLVVKGEDGLYYKLNTDGVKVDAEQTEYNSLNGSIITAKSITATKVSVDDLVAFDATIGGFNITSKSLYSGVKESVNNTTKGIYLDKDGQIAFGDSSNYLKFFKDTDGFWKLVISANSLKFSTSNKNVEEVIEDITDKVQKTVKTVEEYFAISSSPTTKPTTGWNKTPPVWQDGKYIWSKTKTIYTDGTSTETEPVCITGATGATGRPGTDGSSGVGIKSVTNYYLATSVSSGVTESTSGWTTTIQTISPTNKYLWNYEVSTYTDNSKVKTTPVIIGVYGDKGQNGSNGIDGQAGADGVGIKAINEKYAVSTSNTTAPTTWYNTVQTMTATNKYLWNYEIITYTNNTTSETSKRVIGVYGDKGNTGATGPSGKGIKTVTNYYLAINVNTGVTENTSGWTTSIQTITSTKKYLWNYELITYTDNSTIKTTPLVIGVYGDKGQTGSTGATGIGIKSISEKYAVSTSNSTAPTTWYDSVQVMTPTNRYLWNYEIITYTNNTTSETSKRVIGVYGDKGQTGATGATGVGISSVDVEYYLSTSNTTQTGGSWSTNAPTWVDGKYMWSRTKTTTTNGQTTTSKPVCITGGKGATGAAGQNGATGQGVESITEEYYLSTSKTTQSGGSWVTTPPTWSTGKYLWTRSKIVYKNPTSTKYTTPVCDSSWEAVNEIEVGGRNLWPNSSFNQGLDSYSLTLSNGTITLDSQKLNGNNAIILDRAGSIFGDRRCYITSKNSPTMASFKKDDEFILTAWVYVEKQLDGVNLSNIMVRGTSGDNPSIIIPTTSDIVGKWIKLTSKVFKAGKDGTFNNCYVLLGGNGRFKVSQIQLEKGNKPTDWTPAPEDVENNLNNLESTMNGAFKDGILSDAEKKAIKQSYQIIQGDNEEVGRTYNALNANSNLIGTPKTNLTNAKVAYNNAYNSLKSFINTALNASKVTSAMISSIDSAFNTYRSTLGTLNTRIQEAIDSINSKKVDDIEVGGRNLLSNSNRTVGEDSTREFIQFADVAPIFDTYGLIEYTISFDIKSKDTSKQNAVQVYGQNGSTTRHSFSKTITVTTEWQRKYITIIPILYNDSVKQTMLSFYGTYETGNIPVVKNVKVEKGNKPTDWTPAPEDTEKVTNNLQTQITTNLKGIEALIKDTTITEGSSSTSLKDAHMSLKATVNGLNSTVANHTSSITTVKTDLGKVDGKINTAKADAISTAGADATSKSNKAKTDAIAAASTDATSKANNALNSAKSYTNAQITTVNTRVSNAESSITQLNNSITNKVWQSDIDKTINTITPDITYAKDYVKALEDNKGYRYKHDVIVYGDSDKYYPVIIKGGNQYVRRKIVVNRNYFEQAPNDWNNTTHKGALNVVIDTNFGGWGGAQYSWSIYALSQTYGNTFAGCMNCGADVMFAIFLRGGGETGALYHLYSDQSLVTNIYNKLPDGTVLPAPQIAYNKDLIFYSPKSDGTAYEYYAPPPRTLTKEVLEEIQSRRFIDNANQARKDIATITTEVTTVKEKAATLETNLNGITSKVTNLESTTKTLDGKVNKHETRIQSTEQKVTATGVITTITDAVNSGTNSIKTTQFILDKNGATINNGKFVSKDTSGKKKYELDGQALKLYDYTVTTDRVAGAIESRHMIANGDIVGMSILCRDNKLISIDYVSSGNDDITQENSNPFARFWNPNDLYKRQIEFFKRVHLNGNSISFSQQNGGYDSYFKATGYQLSTYLPNPSTTINREYASWIIANNVTGEDHIILMPRQMEIYPYIWNQGGIYSAGSISSAKIVTQDISTDSYGIRSLNSYQTADALVSDFGEGIINDDGECIVFLDEVFKEIVNTNCTYRVILTAYDENDEFDSIDLKCIKKTSEYFTVKSKCIGLKFDWGVVAKEKGEEMTRLRNTKLTRDLSLDVKVSDLLNADDSIKSKDAAKQLTEQSYINLEINNNEDVFLKEFEINNEDILSEIEGMI